MTHAELYGGFTVGTVAMCPGGALDRVKALVPSTDVENWDKGYRLVLENNGLQRLENVLFINHFNMVEFESPFELLGPVDGFEVDEYQKDMGGLQTITVYGVFVHYKPSQSFGGRDCIATCANREDADTLERILEQVVENYVKPQ